MSHPQTHTHTHRHTHTQQTVPHSFLQLTLFAIFHYQFRATYCIISLTVLSIPFCCACLYGLLIFNLFPAFDIFPLFYYFLWMFLPFLIPWRFYFNISFTLPLYSFLCYLFPFKFIPLSSLYIFIHETITSHVHHFI